MAESTDPDAPWRPPTGSQVPGPTLRSGRPTALPPPTLPASVCEPVPVAPPIPPPPIEPTGGGVSDWSSNVVVDASPPSETARRRPGSFRPWLVAVVCLVVIAGLAGVGVVALIGADDTDGIAADTPFVAASPPAGLDGGAPDAADLSRFRAWLFAFGVAVGEDPGEVERACGAIQDDDGGAFFIIGPFDSGESPRTCALDLGDHTSRRLVIGAAPMPCVDGIDCAVSEAAEVTITLDGVPIATVARRVSADGTGEPWDVEFAGHWATTAPLSAGTYELTMTAIGDGKASETTWLLDVGRHPDVERTEATTATGASPGRACDVEKRTIETAIDAYRAQRRREPRDWDDLVPDLVIEQPEYWTLDVDANGRVHPVPVSDGRCDR